jgi:cation diffusion facilitator CzcD-associated flavoprotein CzcO
MTTGQLSAPRRPDIAGLERFRGQWVQTSKWPHEKVELEEKRIGIVGTGSSGVQAIPILAEYADHLYVFQRTAHYAVPARNCAISAKVQRDIAARLPEEREGLLTRYPGGTRSPRPEHPVSHYSPGEQFAMMERQWELGGQRMNAIFSDQGTNKAANDVVAEFVRNKIRAIVRDASLADKLCPSYPIGTRRLALDTGYYETYNRPDVTLVDVKADPIVEITETGIRTRCAHYELDLIVFALGFRAFTGSLDAAGIRNERGKMPSDGWSRGPRTLLGLMSAGFPNLFLPTGPGSPSVLANLFVQNEFEIDWIGDCIAYLDAHGAATIEPTSTAQDAWTAHVAEVASRLLRRQVNNYMVHVNADDGSRVFIPYVGGFDRYVATARDIAARGYEGFLLRDHRGDSYVTADTIRESPPENPDEAVILAE